MPSTPATLNAKFSTNPGTERGSKELPGKINALMFTLSVFPIFMGVQPNVSHSKPTGNTQDSKLGDV